MLIIIIIRFGSYWKDLPSYVEAVIECNRGHGSWSTWPLAFGPSLRRYFPKNLGRLPSSTHPFSADSTGRGSMVKHIHFLTPAYKLIRGNPKGPRETRHPG